MKRNACGMDERQQAIRGTIFLHMLLIMSGLVAVSAVLMGRLPLIDGGKTNLLILFVTLVAGSVEMIARDAYPALMSRKRWLLYFMSAVALLLFGLGLYHILAQGQSFLEAGALTDVGFTLCLAVGTLVIVAAYFIKRARLAHSPQED